MWLLKTYNVKITHILERRDIEETDDGASAELHGAKHTKVGYTSFKGKL